MIMIDILSLNKSNMEKMAVDAGFPAFRGRQLYHWCHEKDVLDFSLMNNLPAAFRDYLIQNGLMEQPEIVSEKVSSDLDTVKLLLRFGNDYIETVLMRYNGENIKDRNTLCISTQVGCAMGCKFCATGLNGFSRNLTVGEIISQVNCANEYLKKTSGGRVSNIVFMGMGEPFLNFEHLIQSIEIINDAKGIGMRRITVSTCGIIPKIFEIAKMNLQLTLAVSLHSPYEKQRSDLMPVNNRFPLKELIPALDTYIEMTGKRVSIEYALFNINDSLDHAEKLVSLLKGKLYHVNIVPGNYVEGTGLIPSDSSAVKAFLSTLEQNGIACSVRKSMGVDVEGACGQLRAKYNAGRN